MPPEADYTLAELASLADVSPRTVRYYVAQGLLRSPEGAGPATRYPASTLARLKLIKQLQRQHQPLAEIRTQLARLTDEEATELAAIPDEPPPDSALHYVRALLSPDAKRLRVREISPPPVRQPPPRFVLRSSDHLEIAPEPSVAGPTTPAAALATAAAPTASDPTALATTPAAPPTTPAAVPITPRITTPSTPERSQWERIVLEPDVELHVRRPLSRIANKRVERLVTFARQLLEEDKP